MFTKSKDASVTGLLELSVINLFFLCFQEFTYCKIDLILQLKSWQTLGRDFEDRVKFTRKGHRKRILSHWWLSNCHKLSFKSRKYGSIRAKWESFRPLIPLHLESGTPSWVALSLICCCCWWVTNTISQFNQLKPSFKRTGAIK